MVVVLDYVMFMLLYSIYISVMRCVLESYFPSSRQSETHCVLWKRLNQTLKCVDKGLVWQFGVVPFPHYRFLFFYYLFIYCDASNVLWMKKSRVWLPLMVSVCKCARLVLLADFLSSPKQAQNGIQKGEFSQIKENTLHYLFRFLEKLCYLFIC